MIPHTFSGFPIKEGLRKTSHYDGVASIERVGPDYRCADGEPHFVVLAYKAMRKDGEALGPDHEIKLAEWLARKRDHCTEITKKLTMAAMAEGKIRCTNTGTQP